MAEESDSISCEAKAEVLRRNWELPLACVVVALVAVYVGRGTAVALAWPTAFMAIVLAVGSITRNAFPRARQVIVRASRSELVLGADPAITVEQITEAKLESVGPTHTTMRILLRDGGRRWLRLSPSDAASVLRVLGVGAGARRATFALAIPFGRRLVASVIVLGVLLLVNAFLRDPLRDAGTAIVGTLVVLSMSAPFVAWIAGLLWRGRLVIAADGITVKWGPRERFIAFAEIAKVDAVSSWTNRRMATTRVELRSGRSRVLCAREQPVTDDQVGAEARAMHVQLVEAFESARRRVPDAQSVTTLLAGDGRSGAEWLAHLDAVIGGVTRYRVAAPAPEVLAAIASDPTGDIEARAGAAVVLARVDPRGRDAVRVAADACAEPALRDALVAISEAESDEAFANALERARRR